MIFRLVILNGERRGERITVTREPMIIGRAETCDIRFADPEIALTHAEVSHKPEGLFIRDLGSMNRLLINNREVREVHPKHGDVVEVGQTRFLVQAYVQAEVQGDEEENPRRYAQWFLKGGIVFVVLALLYAMYQCRPVIPHRPVATFKPHAYRTNTAGRAQASAAKPATNATATLPDKAVTAPSPAQPPAPVPPPTDAGETTQAVEPGVATPPPTTPSTGKEEETAAALALAATNLVAADVIAIAQQELEQAAAALLESKVRDMMEEAQRLATNKGPAAAEQLLAAIEKIKPDFLEAVAARAGLLEEQGQLEPALKLWEDIQQRASPPLAAQAETKLKQLGRAREQLVFPFVGRIKIVETAINKFPENERYREMRLLTLRLVATELQKEIETGAVRLDFRFYDQDPQTGRILPTTAQVSTAPVTVEGPWRATEEKTVEATYVAPTVDAAQGPPAQYYGFVIRVYYHGALQDERIQPRDLPADVELLVPAGAPATNLPPAPPVVNQS